MRFWKSCFAVTLTFVFFSGCATVKKTDGTAAAPAPTPTSTKKETRKAVATKNQTASSSDVLTIEAGQTLWDISRSAQTYEKSCQWPVLYKANKEKIQDPDLIYPGQVLRVPRSVSPTDGANACKAAAKYGKHAPHSKPRVDVQVDY